MKKITLEKYVLVNPDEQSISVDCIGGFGGFSATRITNLEDETKNIYNEYPKLYSLKGAQFALRKYKGFTMKKVKVTYEIED